MIEVSHVSFAYEDSETRLLDDVSFSVEPGELVALVGKNGSGKSTLARSLSGTLLPSEGNVLVDGHAASSRAAWPLVGMVGQDPTAQMVSSLVRDEVAFGPCNLGLPPDETNRRVEESLATCGLEDFAGRSVEQLSGGELQRLALAGVLALHPRYIVADEAASQLDLAGRRSFAQVITRLCDQGVGVLMVSHLLEQVVSASRVVLLDQGHIQWIGTPDELLRSDALLEASGLHRDPLARPLSVLARAGCTDLREALDGPDAALDFVRHAGREEQFASAVYKALRGAGKGPRGNSGSETAGAMGADDCHHPCRQAQSQGQGREQSAAGGQRPLARRLSAGKSGPFSALALHGVSVCYEGSSIPALSRVNLTFSPGRLVLIAGRSGSGKSTLARVASGVLRPNEGEAVFDPIVPGGARKGAPAFSKTDLVAVGPQRSPVRPGEVGLAFQRPEEQLFCSTVLEDVAYGPKNSGASEETAVARAQEALTRLGVPEELWERSPFELSGGEQRRVALAGMVALDYPAYVFDEPTAGLDGPSRELLHDVVGRLCAEGRSVVVVSHDVDEWLPQADDVVLLRAGRVVYAGNAEACRVDGSHFERAGLPTPALVRYAEALDNGIMRRSAAPQQENDAEPRSASSSSTKGVTGAEKSSENDLGSVAEDADSPRRSHPRRGRTRQPARIALPVGMYVPRRTPFHVLDARVKILLALALTVATFAAFSPLSLCLMLAVVVACERAAGISGRALARALKPTLVVLVFALLANALRLDGSGDIRLVAMVGLSSAGLVRGVLAVVRIVIVVAGVLVVSASTTGPQIADALGRLLRPLGKLGVPTSDLSMVLSVALRFLPVSVRTFDQVHAAQEARGAQFDVGSLSQRLGKWIAVLVPMVVALFRRADELAVAMHDRCYGYTEREVAHVSLSGRDWAILLGGCALLLAACLLAA